MAKITDPIEKLKRPQGGARPGAGRPKGRKNNSTLAKEAAAQQALDDMLKELPKDKIDAMQPLDVMLWAMRLQVKVGNIMAAAAVAEKAANFVHPRVPAQSDASALPEDLAPDPEPQPDEPGPTSAPVRPGA